MQKWILVRSDGLRLSLYTYTDFNEALQQAHKDTLFYRKAGYDYCFAVMPYV